MLLGRSEEDGFVYLRSNKSAAMAALATALVMGGCSAGDYESSGWFSKPVDLFGRRGGYTFSQLGGPKQDRAITANDLVDASGACPRAAPPAPEAQAAAGSPAPSPAGAPEEVALLRGGVAVGMSECDVIARLGRPVNVSLGNNQNGDRTAIIAFAGGPRPGVYHFVGGRLSEMDRGAEPPPGSEQKKLAGSKKPAKSKKPKGDDASKPKGDDAS
jgi:hypothetical protein